MDDERFGEEKEEDHVQFAGSAQLRADKLRRDGGKLSDDGREQQAAVRDLSFAADFGADMGEILHACARALGVGALY